MLTINVASNISPIVSRPLGDISLKVIGFSVLHDLLHGSKFYRRMKSSKIVYNQRKYQNYIVVAYLPWGMTSNKLPKEETDFDDVSGVYTLPLP